MIARHVAWALLSIVAVLIGMCVLLYVGVELVRNTEAAEFDEQQRKLLLSSSLDTRIATMLRSSHLSLVAVADFMGASFDANEDALSTNTTFTRVARGLHESEDLAVPFSSLVFAPRVAKSNVTAYEAWIRRINGPPFANYTVNTTASDGDVFPTLYRYPLTQSASRYRFGFDLLSDDERRAPILETLRSNQSVASEPLQQFGTRLTAVNVYHVCRRFQPSAIVVGVAVALFPLADFAVASLIDVENEIYALDWFDVTDNRSLYSWQTTNQSAAPSTTQFSLQHQFAERQWRIDVTLIAEPEIDTLAAATAVFVLVTIAVLLAVAVGLIVRAKMAREAGQRQLLSMIFPPHIASALISKLRVRDGQVLVAADGSIAHLHSRVTLVFIDICDFTTISSFLTPTNLVKFVDEFVCIIDRVRAEFPRLLKIKTIGDAYFVAAGLSDQDGTKSTSTASETPHHVQSLIDALEFCQRVQHEIQNCHRFHVEVNGNHNVLMRRPSSLASSQTLSRGTIEERRCRSVFSNAYDHTTGELTLQIRIGVHVGDVVAGVCGQERPVYDLWGDACNVAARIENAASNGTIQVSSQVHDLLRDYRLTKRFRLRKRHRELLLKGVGAATAFKLLPRKDMKEDV